MGKPRVVLQRLAGVLVLTLGACASATQQAPVSVTSGPASPAVVTAEAAARQALTPPQSAVRTAEGIALSGTEL
ncbi:MAG: hypothetical protein KFH98_08295, partial [Gemmatimonadetes bacterium]|nr:hypothetical protein [Gemmatimonadota bacterium]